MMDLLTHLKRQMEWSEETFGPGARTEGIVDHITKELAEILTEPHRCEEWADVAILALDGAWRCLAGQGVPAEKIPAEIARTIVAKQTKNEGRQWPNWRTAEPGKAIEHIRG